LRATGFVLAAKVIKVKRQQDTVAKEIDVLKQVNNRNCVRYFGMSSCTKKWETDFKGSIVHGNDVWVLDLSYLVFDINFQVLMEYCGAGSICDLLEYSAVPEKTNIWILSCALQGLEYLHGLNIIHRDIKSAK
jgi:serine/threonine protein kinase